jgi:hypothetical protein
LWSGFFDVRSSQQGPDSFAQFNSGTLQDSGRNAINVPAIFRAKGQMIWELHCRLVGIADY